MSKARVYYSIDEIDKREADFNIIYGERSNGKSYSVKHSKGVEHYLETGKRFILLRRLREEISNDKVEAYFADVDIYKLTDGRYNCISVYRKAIFLSNYDFETTKTKRGEKIGYAVALSTEQNYAGGSYLDVDIIIFEEFMSRGTYLNSEPDKLMNFYCTVDRKRHIVKMYLVGNTISRVNPYLEDWGLLDIVRNQKQGTIEEIEIFTGTYTDEGDPIYVKIAIEYCRDSGRSSFTIGKHKDMLNKGSWQADPQPRLTKSKNLYKIIYRVGFEYKSFRFIGELLRDKENYSWFIYPYKKEFNDNMLIFSDKIKESKKWQRNIYDITIKSDKLQRLLYTFRESNIFYSDDLTGTEFKEAIDFMIRK